MRRGSFAADRQPVRNLNTAPTFDAGSGSVVVRTNNCLNPSFAASSAVINIRTNFCTNPRLVTSNFGGYGTQTLANITGVTGQPDGITTAVRVSYTAGAANPGALVLILPDISTQYTVSAWVYNEGATTESIAIALKGASSGGTQSVPQGVWTRLAWTMTTPGSLGSGNDYGIRIAAPAATGSFLVTGVLVEKTSYTDTYFDGSTAAAGDFTYGWNTTANASISFKKAPNAQYWAAASTAVIYRGTQTAVVGTTVGVVVTKGFNLDGIYVSDVAVTPGIAYTWSAYIKLLATVPNMSMVIRWKDSGGATISDSILDSMASLTVNSFGRISITATAPALTVTAQPMIRIFGTHTPTTFYVDAGMFETMNLLTPYFDGSTAAAGDFTYDWNGASNQAPSREKGLGMPNINTTGSSVRALYQSGDRPDATGAKFARTYFQSTGISTGVNTIDNTIRSGVTRTDLIWLRASRACTVKIRYRTVSGAGVVDYGNVNIAAANQWQLFRIVGAPNVGDGAGLSVLMDTSSLLVSGDTLDVGGHMCVEGVYDGDYVDGSKPFSKWDGTALASTSVGYPPDLYGIAGKPAVDLAASANTGGVAIPVGAFDARTIYVVYQSFGQTTAYQTCFYYGVASTKGFILQSANTGVGSMSNRYDFPGGSTNGAINFTSTGRSVRTHVAAFSFATGLTTVNSCVDGGTDVVTNPNPGTGWDDGRAQTMTNSSELKAVRALVYYADHDRATRLAISRYLGNKYGANVA